MKIKTSISLLLLCLFSFLGARGQTTTVFTSSTGYTVSLTLEILEINAPQNCNWGYNYTVDIAYDVVISGTNAPSSLWVLQGQLACGNSNLFFNLPNNGGSGVSTTSNTYNPNTDCNTASALSLECFDALISIEGPNLQPGNTTIDLSSSGSPETFTWIGNTSTNWATASNWQEGAVPASGDHVVITDGTYQPEITGTISVSDMDIQAGASISFENTSSTLSLLGDLTVDGHFDQDKGQVIFEGDELQAIKGNSTVNFFNARIYTDDTVRCLTSVGFRGNLMPYKGVFDFNNQEISILSNAASTGAIAEIKAAAEILGDTITYQRYFPAGSGSWRLLGSPIQDATFEQWNDDFPTTGFSGADYPNFPSASNPWSNIRAYEESFINGEEADRNFGFQSIENINDTIETGKGYFVYFNPGPTTIDIRGPFNKGDLFFQLSYTPSELGNGNDGWNLIANPYPGTVDWDNIGGKFGLNDAIYAFDPSTGQYSSYVNGVSIGSLNSRVGSGQAFWVQANQNSFLTGITFSEASKTSLDGIFMRSSDIDTESLVRIQLQSSGKTDEVVFGLNEASTENFDAQLDAYKFYAADLSIPSIAIITETSEEGNVGEKLSISMMPKPESHQMIQLEVLPGSQGEFILANQEVDAFESNLCLVLEDSETNNFVAFNQGDLYPFVMGESSDPLRFKIHFNAPIELSKLDESCPDASNGSILAQGYGEAPWTYIWRDEMGQTLKTSYGMNGPDELSDLGPGFYEVEVMNSNELCASNTQIAQITAALPSEISVITERTSCNTPGTGSVELNLSNDYTWNIEVQDENYNAISVLDDAQGMVLVNQLDAQEYHIVAISSCGLMADIPSVDLTDNSAAQADFEVSSTEVYVNQNVYITSNAVNVLALLYDFGDGTLDSLNANPMHQFDSPGIYEITQYAQSENCTESSTMMIEVFERESNEDIGIDGFEAGGGLLAEQESDAEGENDLLELSIQENALQLDVKQAFEEEVLISIFNTSGQRISQQKQVQLDLGALLVPTSDLAMGVYYITVSAQSKVLFSQQFIQP